MLIFQRQVTPQKLQKSIKNQISFEASQYIRSKNSVARRAQESNALHLQGWTRMSGKKQGNRSRTCE